MLLTNSSWKALSSLWKFSLFLSSTYLLLEDLEFPVEVFLVLELEILAAVLYDFLQLPSLHIWQGHGNRLTLIVLLVKGLDGFHLHCHLFVQLKDLAISSPYRDLLLVILDGAGGAALLLGGGLVLC
ncbi:PREDICTED: uncharacterized protein LOC101305975 [Fragaria vesca subsp. vesca]